MIYSTTSIDLDNIMCSGISQIHKDKYRMIPFIQDKVPGIGKLIETEKVKQCLLPRAGGEEGQKRNYCLMSTEFLSEMMNMFRV